MLTAITGNFHSHTNNTNNGRGTTQMMTHAPPGTAPNGAGPHNHHQHYNNNNQNQQSTMPSLHNVIIKGRWKIVSFLLAIETLTPLYVQLARMSKCPDFRFDFHSHRLKLLEKVHSERFMLQRICKPMRLSRLKWSRRVPKSKC
jgi:hypothetical protein